MGTCLAGYLLPLSIAKVENLAKAPMQNNQHMGMNNDIQ